MNYRKRYYDQYVTVQLQPAGGVFTERDYRDWAIGAKKRVQGWLPVDHSAAILDIGCGSGKLLYLLRDLGYTNLTGIDLSPEQVEHARQQFPESTIIQGNALDLLEHLTSHYDLICAFDIIEHLNKDEIVSLLNLIYHALNPGGRLILQTPNAESPWFGSVAYGDFTHEWFFTPAGLQRVLQLIGFDTFRARETGPSIHGIKSLIRASLWRLIHMSLFIWNLAETGGTGERIYTRVFVASAVRKQS